jgi:transcriptional regulator with GAF, ATPase, and Fis domain
MKRPDVLDEMMELTQRLAKPMALEQALARVIETALRVLPCDHALVKLLDERRRELGSSARGGRGGRQPGARALGDAAAAWVCEHGRSARVSDVRTDERFRSGGAAGSLLAAPLMLGGRTVGALVVTHAQADAFGDKDEGMALLLANAALPLIDRARVERLNLLPKLEHALASPLRLRLVAELLQVEDVGLSLDEAVVRSGRHRQDVERCLRPLLGWGVVETDGKRYRIAAKMPEALMAAVRRAVSERAEDLNRERHVRHHLLGGMIGIDPKMQMVFEIVQQVARIDVPVLIDGETGTGKELVARAIHDISPRRAGFFGAVNCATLSESLFESQVFGHVRGAFTGAVVDYVGLVERCHHGTLFLDEVGELSLANQVKLLRLLQEGIFTRLGESEPRRSDFRLISATNRDLQAMVSAGAFREDLYYRLAVFPIRIPSLRERIGDLKYLVDGILAMYAQRFHTGGDPPTITPDALRRLERYRWPGNVRELENAIARAVVMSGGGPIGPEHLPEVELLSENPHASTRPPDDTGRFSTMRSLEDMEREHIERVLRSQGGNIKAASEILSISRTTLYKKIRDYGIGTP